MPNEGIDEKSGPVNSKEERAEEVITSRSEKDATSITTTENEKVLPEREEEMIYNINILLPQAPSSLKVKAAAHEPIHEIRQTLHELPQTLHHTAFHLEYNSLPLNDYAELHSIQGLTADAEFVLVEDDYTERTAKAHFLRVKELITPTSVSVGSKSLGDGWGISGGVSIVDDILKKPPSTAPWKLVPTDFSSQLSLIDCFPCTNVGPTSATSCLKSFSLSGWNPPPPNLRLQGHILYLQCVTLEGDLYHITSSVKGFYLSKSNKSKFDPSPKYPSKRPVHSLLALLHSLSTQFTTQFEKLRRSSSQERDSSIQDILMRASLTNSLPAHPWLVHPPEHFFDPVRSQEAYLQNLSDSTSNLRDWNDELQSTRALPSASIPDRILRDKLLQKSLVDFAACGILGGMMVRRGELVSLEPVGEEAGQSGEGGMWCYNNIFLTSGTEDPLGTFASEGGVEAARVAVGKDVAGVRIFNNLHFEDQQSFHGMCTLGTVVIDYAGERLVGQSVVPGIFQAIESPTDIENDEKGQSAGAHRIVYGGVDGGDRVFDDEEMARGFEKIAKKLHLKRHAVWENAPKPQYGSDPQEIKKNGEEHPTNIERKKRMLWTSLDTKGLKGADGRKYVLDLYKLAPLDILWIEQCCPETYISPVDEEEKDKDYPHKLVFLRTELVEAFWEDKLKKYVQLKVAERKDDVRINHENGTNVEFAERNDGDNHILNGIKTKGEADQSETKEEIKETSALEQVDLSDFDFRLNPDVFTSSQAPVTEEEKAQIQADEQDVRDCCMYLRQIIIPGLISEWKEDSGDSGLLPIDGYALTRNLHKRGINVRYLGYITQLLDTSGARSRLDWEGRRKVIKDVLVTEMVSRGTKYIFNKYLRGTNIKEWPRIISHFLNCLVGYRINMNPEPQVDASDERNINEKDKTEWSKLTPESVKEQVESEVRKRFLFNIPEQWWDRDVRLLVLLREVCLKMGLQLRVKEYVLDKKDQLFKWSENRSGKMRNGVNGIHRSVETAFTADDVLGVVPVIKEASMKSSLAEEALETGRLSILQNEQEVGLDLLAESLTLHEQIYGFLHPQVARAYARLSLIYHSLDEKTIACDLAKKAVIVAERTLGWDNSETIWNWINWALFEHEIGETETGLRIMGHALELWKVVYGEGHPDEVTLYTNVAVMLQSLKRYQASLPWFAKALELAIQIHSLHSWRGAQTSFSYSQALALAQDPKSSVSHMRNAFNFFSKELGSEDRNTKETEFWLEQLTTSAVSLARQEKDLKAKKIPNGSRGETGKFLQSKVTLTPAVNAVEAVTSGNAAGVASRGNWNIDELVKYIGDSEVKNKNGTTSITTKNGKKKGKR